MTDRRTYVLDTSVLLSDPWAIMRFAEHEVVVPLVVISELEAKRHHHGQSDSLKNQCQCCHFLHIVAANNDNNCQKQF